MALQVFDKQGKSYTLAEKLGAGGEGIVYRCDEHPDVVAKIYHEKIDTDKEEKLLWMAGHKNEQLLKFAAWVLEVLYDRPNGNAIGFLMPVVEAKEIHELYSPKSRRVHFPRATWQFLIHTATNVARAFYCLHSESHVMGDVNHGNCVVLPDGTVKLIDCDSYGILTDKQRYTCDVGVMSFLAPELHGKDLSTTERTDSQDNFGLAVMIFQLLFLGRHPFAGQITGDVDLSLGESIEQYLFAYGNNAADKGVTRPPGTLSLTDLPNEVAELFESAFGKRRIRPQPGDWVKALQDLQDNLQQCTSHTGHQYPASAVGCPFCRIEAQTGASMFPFVLVLPDSKQGGSLIPVTLEKMLDRFGGQELSISVPEDLPEPEPSLGMRDAVRGQDSSFRNICMTFAGLILFLSVFAGPSEGLILAFVLITPFIVMINHFNKGYRGSIVDELEEKKSELAEIESRYSDNSLKVQRDEDLEVLKHKVRRFYLLSAQTSENKERDEFLRHYFSSFRISEITGFRISIVDRTLLIGNGINTANEVVPDVIEKISIDADTSGRLLNWRNEIEIQSRAIPKSQREVEVERRSVELDINSLLNRLHTIELRFKGEYAAAAERVRETVENIKQLQVDNSLIGSGGMAVLVLIISSVAMPSFGGVVRDLLDIDKREIVLLNKAPEERFEAVAASLDERVDALLLANELPPESFSYESIEELNSEKRKEYSARIFDLHSGVVNRSSNYTLSLRLLEHAKRFHPSEDVLLALGPVQFEQKLFNQCIGNMNQLKRKFPVHKQFATYYTGLSLQELGSLQAARVEFETLAALTNKSTDYALLGSLCAQIPDVECAETALNKSIELDGKNLTARYSLALILRKKGDEAGFQVQYDYIFDNNPTLGWTLHKELSGNGTPGGGGFRNPPDIGN